MEYRSRRERREAERAGLAPVEAAPEFSSEPVSENPAEKTESVSTEEKAFPSRRELRNQANKSLSSHQEPSDLEPEEEKAAEENHHSEVNSSEGDSTRSDISPEKPEALEQDLEANPGEEPLTAKNYLYQESSNTFTMDSIPDSLTATNGDLVVTNSESITVVTGSHPSLSSIMEDLKYDSADQKDTVAGKISLVDPVSAKLVAESREPEVVVPGKIVVRNRVVSVTFAILGGIMFVLAGIGLWWALSEMGPFSS
ncbi:MAG TPA: hypothetical protein VIB61_01060 [Microbacteriaceae bacterium]